MIWHEQKIRRSTNAIAESRGRQGSPESREECRAKKTAERNRQGTEERAEHKAEQQPNCRAESKTESKEQARQQSRAQQRRARRMKTKEQRATLITEHRLKAAREKPSPESKEGGATQNIVEQSIALEQSSKSKLAEQSKTCRAVTFS